jgi:hypothetical protein
VSRDGFVFAATRHWPVVLHFQKGLFGQRAYWGPNCEAARDQEDIVWLR